MGVYVYCTKPSHIAHAIVEGVGGKPEHREVALYRYAYKPTWSWDSEKLNARWRFSSGALACASAWTRAHRAVPDLGAYFDDETGTVSDPRDEGHSFQTGNAAEVYDDCVKSGPRILEWLALPKGITVQAPRIARPA